MGPGSQKLDRIGANGYMVVRLRVACLHDAGSCSFLEKMTARGDNSDQIWVVHLKVRSYGPGEPSGATRGPRGRPWRPPEYPDGLDGSDGVVPDKERG